MAVKIVNLTDAEFEATALKTQKTVIIDFWAQWCAPCLTIGAVLEEIAQNTTKDLLICKINIDDNPETPAKYRIRSIPTLMVLKNGEVIATAVGALTKGKIEAFIDENA